MDIGRTLGTSLHCGNGFNGLQWFTMIANYVQ